MREPVNIRKDFFCMLCKQNVAILDVHTTQEGTKYHLREITSPMTGSWEPCGPIVRRGETGLGDETDSQDDGAAGGDPGIRR